jgi:hypothetical protein
MRETAADYIHRLNSELAKLHQHTDCGSVGGVGLRSEQACVLARHSVVSSENTISCVAFSFAVLDCALRLVSGRVWKGERKDTSLRGKCVSPSTLPGGAERRQRRQPRRGRRELLETNAPAIFFQRNR